MARWIGCSSSGAVVADIMIGAIIRSPANTVGLARVVAGAVIRAVTDATSPARWSSQLTGPVIYLQHEMAIAVSARSFYASQNLFVGIFPTF